METQKNTKDKIDELIIDSLSHNLNSVEQAKLDEWIASSSDNYQHFMQLKENWQHDASTNNDDFDAEAAYRKFNLRVQQHQRSKQFSIKPMLRIASIVIIAFVLGGIAQWVLNSFNESNTDLYYTLSVPMGAKSRIELPDKSVVWLNAGSTLRYSQHFAKYKRIVELSGEAFFEVTKNKAIPFIVKSNDLNVKVLGTKFNVKSYAEDTSVVVTLLEGSVNLSKAKTSTSEIMLKPNERCTWDKKTNHKIVSHVNAADSYQWTKGKLIFEEEYFGQIVQRLEREYNVTIHLKNKELNDLKFYGDFRNTQSITEIFDIMTMNNKFRYEIKENVITVYK